MPNTGPSNKRLSFQMEDPKYVKHDSVPPFSDEYTNIHFDAFVRALTAEFSEYELSDDGWELFRIGELIVEIDVISGFIIAKSAFLSGDIPAKKVDPDEGVTPDENGDPDENSCELAPVMRKLSKMVKLRKKLFELDFHCTDGIRKDEGRYSLRMVRVIESCDIEAIVGDLKNIRQTLEAENI